MARKRSGKGGIVRKFVRHPGTKAQPFLIPSLRVGAAFLRRNLPRAIAQAGANPARLRSAIDRLVRQAAFFTQRSAQQLAPVDTGLLKRSINVRKRREFFYTIGTNVVYAEAVERGTRPHIIRPRTKKALAFVVKRRARG